MSVIRHVVPAVPTPSDIDIAQSVEPLPITQISQALGIPDKYLLPYGTTRAKVHTDILKEFPTTTPDQFGNYVVVTAINPTPLGEGKSTTTIGLAQCLGAYLDKKCLACVRQPSQGPTFGVKGGAAGGGYSQVIPMDDFNLHGTGDIHAIGAAHNLLAAAIDVRVFHESSQSDDALFRRLTDELKKFSAIQEGRLAKLGITKRVPKDFTAEEKRAFARLDIDPATIMWRRVVDINDRFLRTITVGQGSEEKGMARASGFDITVASEVMAILALSKDLPDLRARLGQITVAKSRKGEPITAEDIGCAGAMAVLLKDSIHPTLMQTLEGTPVLVHCGPFGNIAQGNSSIVADDIALRLVGTDGFVLTEAGFGADMGCEKFFNLKCRASGLKPNAAVLVATCRALKYSGGCDVKDASKENHTALEKGLGNLTRHIQNVQSFGIPVVCVINKFTCDTEAEIDLVKKTALAAGAFDCVMSSHWAHGGAGATAASAALIAACKSSRSSPSAFRLLYPAELPLLAKIETIVTKIYHGKGIQFVSDEVKAKLEALQANDEISRYAICMAKTQYSFSHDPALKGAPTDFVVPIRDVKVNTGAKFVTVFAGDINTMPGLPTRPAFLDIDIDTKTGQVLGLS
eukprot:PhF_6_TR4818/c0_g1_i1/m.6668